MMFTKVVIAVDPDVNVHDMKEVAWRVFANVDPKRDLVFSEGPTDALDHATCTANFSSKLGIDATAKWKEEGYTRGWPEVAVMSDEVKARIDALFPKLGIL
jgi:4-hydroxy-3-polyprenylbenzoate decarboxylase